ncbi:MAG: transglycosylase SLT domain-containing protein [Deltaproteobacteria bacterium]|nr:transglycosylase SLT domain-containing protein [Deltaproteobacteria bacterium]
MPKVIFYLFVALFVPLKLGFSFGKILAVLPLPFPLELIEEKLKEAEEGPDDVDYDREPQGILDKRISSFDDKKGLFRVPNGLEYKVNFWKKIYAVYSTHQYVIHDIESKTIYEVVDVEDIMQRGDLSSGSKIKFVNKRLEEAKRKYQKGSTRVRAQLGQKDKFRKAIQYSGKYLPMMEDTFAQKGLPLELTRLPFVESSFQLQAHSHAGAAGLWQFMRATARESSLVMNDVVDERRDPIKSTEAAAEFLKLNYETLESWPLAVTAYNHGRMGINRITKRMGTEDLVEIVDNYTSPTFGFASKNFYACLLAALEVERDSEKYFGELKVEPPLEYDEVVLKNYISLGALVNYTDVSKNELVELNPALSRKVIKGLKLIPKGFVLRIPKGKQKIFLSQYGKIPLEKRYARQNRAHYHKVRSGDTLSYLASRYRTTVEKLKQINNIEDKRYIQVGQFLVIPR